MVEPSGCIKLIDFGCARAFRDNETSTVTILIHCNASTDLTLVL